MIRFNEDESNELRVYIDKLNKYTLSIMGGKSPLKRVSD
jgi:hypothetical protein